MQNLAKRTLYIGEVPKKAVLWTIESSIFSVSIRIYRICLHYSQETPVSFSPIVNLANSPVASSCTWAVTALPQYLTYFLKVTSVSSTSSFNVSERVRGRGYPTIGTCQTCHRNFNNSSKENEWRVPAVEYSYAFSKYMGEFYSLLNRALERKSWKRKSVTIHTISCTRQIPLPLPFSSPQGP